MIVVVIDTWDGDGDDGPGSIPAIYVEQVGEAYQAVYGWLPYNANETEEEVIGVFAEVEPAVRRLWARRDTMDRLVWGNQSSWGWRA